MGAKFSSGGATVFHDRTLATGTHIENEPIIKSDGVGEVMQWLASTGSSKITIDQDASNVIGLTVSSGSISMDGVEVGTGNGTTSNVVVGSSDPMGSAHLSGTNNTAIGDNTMGAVGASDVILANTAVGSASMASLTTGDYNTAVGYNSLTSITDSGGATAIGSQAGQAVGSGATGFTAVGKLAGASNVSGDDITAIGSNALQLFTGSDATAVGSGAAAAASSAAATTAVGKSALAIVTGANNTAVGMNAGLVIEGGISNTVVGKAALDATDDGNFNVAMGHGALGSNCENDNVGIGYTVLNTFTGSNATAVGSGSAVNATSAAALTAVGKDCFGSLVDQAYNTGLGASAGLSTIGTSNTFLGASAGYYAGDVDDCVAIGRDALKGPAAFTEAATYNNDPTITHTADARIVAGLYVTGTGIPASSTVLSITSPTVFELSASTTGGSNGGGDGTLTFYQNSGDSNIAIGSYALDAATTGDRGIAIGHNAGSTITTARGNVAIGYNALYSEDVSDGNVAIGHQALYTQNTDS